uniref:Uncharacterized protein n=1 Tax=Melopsittacus undulatus TaxID=13146 RepID=A0A8V5FWT0_MELUD
MFSAQFWGYFYHLSTHSLVGLRLCLHSYSSYTIIKLFLEPLREHLHPFQGGLLVEKSPKAELPAHPETVSRLLPVSCCRLSAVFSSPLLNVFSHCTAFLGVIVIPLVSIERFNAFPRLPP